MTHIKRKIQHISEQLCSKRNKCVDNDPFAEKMLYQPLVSNSNTESILPPEQKCEKQQLLRSHEFDNRQLVEIKPLIENVVEDKTFKRKNKNEVQKLLRAHLENLFILKLFPLELLLLIISYVDAPRIVSGGKDAFLLLWAFTSDVGRIIPSSLSSLSSSLSSSSSLSLVPSSSTSMEPPMGRSLSLPPSSSNHDSITSQNFFVEKTIHGPKMGIKCACSLPVSLLAIGSFDCCVYIVDTLSGKIINRLNGHQEVVWCMICLKDGRLASSSRDGTIRIWSLKMNKCCGVIRTTGTCMIALNEEDGNIISGSDFGEISLWNVQNGKCIRSKKLEHSSVSVMTYLDENSFLVGLTNGSVLKFNTRTFHYTAIHHQSEHIKSIVVLARHIAIASQDGEVDILNSKTYTRERIFYTNRYRTDYNRHSDTFSHGCNALIASSEGRLISSSSSSLSVWNLGLLSTPLQQHLEGNQQEDILCLCAI